MSVAALSDHPFPAYDGPRPGKRLSTPFVVALTLSVAAHTGVGAYMAYKKFVMPVAAFDEGVPLTMERPPVKPPEPKPNPDPEPPRTTARKIHIPMPNLNATVPPLPVEPKEIINPSVEPPKTIVTGEIESLGPIQPPRPPAVIARPDWLKKPTAAQMGNAFPDRALRQNISGTATLNCKVTAIGAVRDCTVLSETPSEYGFGSAALRVTKHFRMKPQTVDGQPVEGADVRIPMTFRLEE
ncbi:MAG: energy transducer TonB [Caulobacteraceae bacterium]|nr:energy transducer TonB [Caulobacter sp.]RYF92339.1 MAG: energy transducer TonB [Caulobacteraceae bacterium]